MPNQSTAGSCATAGLVLAVMMTQYGTAYAESLLQPAVVEQGQTLCVIRDRVLALDEQFCVELQNEERASANVVNTMLDQFELGVATPTLELDLLEGISLGARYLLQVQPSYRENFFTRIDRYSVDTDIQPGDQFPGLPLVMAIDSGTELVFAQQFVSGTEARHPRNTYLPNRLPITTQHALSLKPGDYVRFNAHLNLLTRFGQVLDIPTELLSAKATLTGVLTGEFQIHVFRLGDQRLRIKLVLERDRSAKLAAELKPELPLALLAIDERTEQLIELQEFDRSLSAAISKADQSIFLIDYTLDLNNPEVADAYDGIFSNGLSLGARALASIKATHGNLKHTLLGSVQELEALQAVGGDAGRDAAVVRNFKGAASASTQQLDFRLALRSYAVERQRLYREKLLSRVRLSDHGSEVTEYFLLPSWTRTRQRSALFGHLQEASLQTADAIFSANADGEPQEFQNIGFRYFYEDSLLRPTEYHKIRDKVELLLPKEGQAILAEKLSGTAWLLEDSHRHVRMSLDYFFREPALRGLEAQGLGETNRLQSEILNFTIGSLRYGEFPFFNGDLDAFTKHYGREIAPRGKERRDPALHARRIAKILWGREIGKISRQLSQALDTGNSNETRLGAFKELRFSSFYRAIGGGLWVHLINQADLDLYSAMYIELNLSAQNRETVSFTYGDDTERELYKAVQFIDSILNDRSADMREPGQIDDIVTRLSVVDNAL